MSTKYTVLFPWNVDANAYAAFEYISNQCYGACLFTDFPGHYVEFEEKDPVEVTHLVQRATLIALGHQKLEMKEEEIALLPKLSRRPI